MSIPHTTRALPHTILDVYNRGSDTQDKYVRALADTTRTRKVNSSNMDSLTVVQDEGELLCVWVSDENKKKRKLKRLPFFFFKEAPGKREGAAPGCQGGTHSRLL